MVKYFEQFTALLSDLGESWKRSRRWLYQTESLTIIFQGHSSSSVLSQRYRALWRASGRRGHIEGCNRYQVFLLQGKEERWFWVLLQWQFQYPRSDGHFDCFCFSPRSIDKYFWIYKGILGEELGVDVGIDEDWNESNDMDKHSQYPTSHFS